MLEIINIFNTNIIQFLNWLVYNENIQKIIFLFADLPIFFLPIFLVVAWLFIRFRQKKQGTNSIKRSIRTRKKNYFKNKKWKKFYQI